MHCDCLGAWRGPLVDNWTQNKQEAGNDLFFISANSTSRNDRGRLDARSKKEAFAWLSVLVLFSALCVLIRRLYTGHELVVWSVEWLTEPVYARRDRLMAVHKRHHGSVRLLDHNLWPSATQQRFGR